jgi:hypothetical protein
MCQPLPESGRPAKGWHCAGAFHDDPRADLMKEHPMTDSTEPDGSNPDAGQPGQPSQPDEALEGERQPKDPTKEGEKLPNSTTDAAPLSNSTDGGLESGDPGVEE